MAEFRLLANRWRKVHRKMNSKGETYHETQRYFRGDELDLDDADAQRLLKAGAVERIGGPQDGDPEPPEAPLATENTQPSPITGEPEDDSERQGDPEEVYGAGRSGTTVPQPTDPDAADPEPEEESDPEEGGDPEGGDPESGEDGEPSDPEGGDDEGGEEGDPEGDPEPQPEPVDYSTWDYSDLQQEAKTKTGNGSGSKADLIERLNQHNASN